MKITRKTLIALVVIVAMVIAVAVLAVTLRKTTLLECEACGGTGEVLPYTCTVCEGAEADCTVCNGVGGTGTAISCDACDGSGKVEADSPYYATFMALVPAIIAIALALLTKEVYSSLFVGILAGAILHADFRPVTAVHALTESGIISAVADTAGIFAFLVILGVLVALLNKTGGSKAFGRWAKTHVKTKVGAILATFVLGVLIFIDDYFNCLTVGSVMRPLTDSHKISREKLAFLIDATAAPICMIAPISSWAAAVTEYVDDGKGLGYFIKAIPYNFYSILTLVFIITIAVMGYDYGKMSDFELQAQKADAAAEDTAEEKAATESKATVYDLILPILALIVFCTLSLLYVGGFFEAGGDYQWKLSGAFGNTDATLALPLGAGVALIFVVIYLIARRLVDFKDSMKAIPEGFIAMVPAILILTFATALKNMTGLLGAKEFVAALLDNAGALQYFLPAIIFLVACGLAFSTGTSWGTFGILIPIVSAGIGLESELGIIAMSACLAGAVCGDHCSPISDTTIMSSAGAQCNHVDHIASQLPYALTVAGVSFVCYLFTGFIQNWLICLPISIVLMVGVLFGIRMILNKKKTPVA